MKRPRSVATLAGLAAAALLSMTGCAALTSPATAVEPYVAGDGTTVEVPDSTLKLANLLVVGAEQGEPAEVIGAVVNSGATPVRVSLGAAAEPGQQPTQKVVTVPANGLLRIGPDQPTSMSLPALGVIPGARLQMTAFTVATGRFDFSVPVLRPQGFYAPFTPAPATEPAAPRTQSTPSSSVTPTPTP